MKPFDPATYLKEVLGPHLESNELPGLFERYCLDPADADEQAIADRCKEVKQLWDRRVEQPKYGGLVRTLLGAHGEALLTLEDPDERRRAAAQAAAAESERAQAGEHARNEWEGLLAVALEQHEGLDPAIRSPARARRRACRTRRGARAREARRRSRRRRSRRTE